MAASLIERLESATEGSRELSDEVLLALGWKKGIAFPDMIWPPDHPGEEGDWDEYESRKWREGDGWCPHPTEDLQDAVDLVPTNYAWIVGSDPKETSALIGPVTGKKLEVEWGPNCAAATPALALSAAILRAHVKETGE